jgi:radical SAM protein with 4Fe4S-binding SPASM domain
MSAAIQDRFCPMPFHHLNIKHNGKVSACWRYTDRIGDYRENSLKEIWNSKATRELRRALLAGEKPVGCKSCWDFEENGSVSTRQTCVKTYQEVAKGQVTNSLSGDFSYPESEIKSIEVRFDTTCNMMCRHCGPDYSSQWQEATEKSEKLARLMGRYGVAEERSKPVKLTETLIDEVCDELAPNLNEILVAGGEPLIHAKHFEFLKRIQKEAPHIRISYNSNLATLSYRGESLVELWKPFREVWMRVSLDGCPKIYPYKRVGQSLHKVEKNIAILNEALPQADLSATCTVSLYNITRLVDIIRYFVSLDVYFHASLVQYPKALNIRLLPKSLKRKLTKEVSDWLSKDPLSIIESLSTRVNPRIQLARIEKYTSSVLNYMNGLDWSSDWQDFLDYAAVLDDYHSTNLFEVYPEYLELKP